MAENTEGPSNSSSNDRIDASAPSPLPAEPWKPRFNPWLIAVVVALAAFMEVLDTSIANVALPYIAGSLGASNDQATWVLTSYLVSNAIVLPISGWFANALGRKRFFMMCLAIFTVSSLLCGIAPSLGGVESLIEQPLVMSYFKFTPEERRQFNIPDNMIRLSCGIENPEDLVADLAQALDRATGGQAVGGATTSAAPV